MTVGSVVLVVLLVGFVVAWRVTSGRARREALSGAEAAAAAQALAQHEHDQRRRLEAERERAEAQRRRELERQERYGARLREADHLRRGKDWDGALLAYDRAIEEWPEGTEAYKRRASLHVTAHRSFDRAISDISRAIEISPADAELFRLRAFYLMGLSAPDLERAEENLDRALADDAYWYLALSHEEAHQKDEARSVLRALMRQFPDSQYYRAARIRQAEIQLHLYSTRK